MLPCAITVQVRWGPSQVIENMIMSVLRHNIFLIIKCKILFPHRTHPVIRDKSSCPLESAINQGAMFYSEPLFKCGQASVVFNVANLLFQCCPVMFLSCFYEQQYYLTVETRVKTKTCILKHEYSPYERNDQSDSFGGNYTRIHLRYVYDLINFENYSHQHIFLRTEERFDLNNNVKLNQNLVDQL